jgi:hypothetical protein
VLIEEQRTVDLTIDAFLHAKHNIPVLTSGGPVVLGKLQEQGLILWLITLEKGIAKVNLARGPAMGGSQQHGSSDRGPSHKRAVGGTIIVHHVTSATPSAFKFIESSTRQALDSVSPSARDSLHAWRHGRTINNFPRVFAFKTFHLFVHGGPELFRVGTGESLPCGWQIGVFGFAFQCHGTLQHAWVKVLLKTSLMVKVKSIGGKEVSGGLGQTRGKAMLVFKTTQHGGHWI